MHLASGEARVNVPIGVKLGTRAKHPKKNASPLFREPARAIALTPPKGAANASDREILNIFAGGQGVHHPLRLAATAATPGLAIRATVFDDFIGFGRSRARTARTR